MKATLKVFGCQLINALMEAEVFEPNNPVQFPHAQLAPPLLCVQPHPLTEPQFCDWIATAVLGDAIQYHEGLLLLDRSELSSNSPKERARIHAVARRAWMACELGIVNLFSQKLAENHYRYLAIHTGGRSKPLHARAGLRPVEPTPAPRNPH